MKSKPISRLSFPLASAIAALLATQSASAFDYYWDTNGSTIGFGTAGGTWAAPTPGPTVGWTTDSTGTTALGSVTTGLTDNIFFGSTAWIPSGGIAVSGTVDAGNLTFAAGTSLALTGGTAINLAAASTIDVKSFNGATIGTALSGAATSLTKNGFGILTLQGANTYGGATVLNGAGLITLSTTGTINSTSGITFNGASLTLTNAAGQGAVDRLSTGTITSNGGTLNYSNANTAPNTYTEGAGTLALTTGQFNTVLGTNQTTSNGQTLTFGGLTQSGTSAVTFSATGTGPQASGLKNMIVVSGKGTTTAGQIIGSWATTGTAANAQSDYAVYNGDYIVPANITATGESTWTNSANAYTSSGALVSLSGDRTMAALRNTGGVATITLSDGTTGYTLATNGILNGVTTVLTIAPGTVSGSVTALGVSGGQIHMTTGTVNGGITVDAPINNNGGAVTLVKNGVGTLILNSTTSDYSGGTVINSGILVFGSGTLGSGGITINGGSSGATTFGRLQWATGNTQDISASLTMVNGGNANLSTGGNTVAFANAVGSSSSSNLTKIGTGQLTFDANNTYTGETGVYAGTLLVNVAQTNTTSVRVGNGTANGGAAGAVLRLGLSNALTSGINVTVDGQGVNTLDLNGFNQTIGNLSLGSNSGGSSGTVTGTGSTLTITNGVTADGHNQGNNSIGTGVISVDFLDLNNTTQNFNTLMPTAARGALTINSVIQNGGLNKTGQLGQIFLTNANTFSGPTTISVGLLRLDNPLALQNSALDTTASIAGAANDGLRLNTGVTTLTLGGLNGNKNFAATGGVFSTTSNNYASVTALTLKPGSGSASYSGVIANGAASMTLTKSGIGTQILSNTNTYTGATDITDGTLLVNSPGSLDLNSAVTVNGGTLGGNGTINGSVTVTAAGNLAPGASAGTLSIGTDLDISAQAGGTGKLNFELDALANTNDLIAVTGALNIGVAQLGFGDFVFTNLGGLQVTGGTPYKLITSSGLTGSLDPANLSGPLGGGLTGTLQITGNDVELVVTSGGDATPPTLLGVNIVDDQSGGPIIVNTLVTYTVTFSEDIDATTVTSADFSNAGTSAFTIGTITETTPTSGIFTVQVTPTSAGTLQLRVPTTADITDAASNPLDNDPAIDDNTTITVQTPFQDWAGGANFGVDSNNDCIDNGMAWVLGAANPAANATALLPTFDNTTDATYFIYTYRRSDAANTAAGITIAVQYSSDLTNNGWTTAIAGPDIIITPTDNFYGASTDKVEVKINRTLAVGNKLFVRLITIQN